MANDKSIQLVNYNKEDKIYTFNKKALQQIIEENGVQDLPVSVISVAGLFRKGKSFLLNFFLRYLYAEDRENWLSNSSEPLKGFEWRGGRKRNTEGIHIWSKIFKLQTADGSQVAVILMDTQGTFDGKSSSKTGAVLFALSALVSSVQVYNLSEQIRGNDLDNLLLFTQYASFAQEESEHKSFQSLIFLIRDWQCYQEFPYGEVGGKKFLNKKLEITPDQDPSLTKVRNDIRSTFEKLSCFLLPHPGKTVATNMNFNGNIKDIDDDFITHIRDFVTSVFSPNNLAVKKVPGLGNLTGSEFVELFATYLKYYNNDELPNEVSKAEAAAEAYYAPLLERCVNIYKTEITEMLDGYLDRIEDCTSQVFKDAHEEMLRMAICSFNENASAKRCIKNITSSKTDVLTARVAEVFVECNKIRSEMYSSSAEEHYNTLAREIVKEYNNKMIAILNKSEDEIEQFTPTAYAESHDKCKTMAIENFGEEKRFCEFDMKEFVEKIKKEIDDSFATNERGRKQKFESAVGSYYNSHFETCLGEYETKMHKLMDKAQLQKDSFARVHEKYKSDAINEFNETKCYREDIKSKYLNKLQANIEDSFVVYEQQRMHIVEYEKEKLKLENNLKLTAEEKKHELETQKMTFDAEQRKLETELADQAEARQIDFDKIKLEAKERTRAETLRMETEAKQQETDAKYQHQKDMKQFGMQELQLTTDAEQKKLAAQNKLNLIKEKFEEVKQDRMKREKERCAREAEEAEGKVFRGWVNVTASVATAASAILLTPAAAAVTAPLISGVANAISDSVAPRKNPDDRNESSSSSSESKIFELA